jgi:hypothetical protein
VNCDVEFKRALNMKKIIRTALTAGLFAFIGVANAQEIDTTTYSSNTYSQDTSSYDENYREQQGSDTYNQTESETVYSDDRSMESQDREGVNSEYSDRPVEGMVDQDQRDRNESEAYQGSNTGEGSNNPQGSWDSNPAQDTTDTGGSYSDHDINNQDANQDQHNDQSGMYAEPQDQPADGRSSSDTNKPEGRSSEYYDRQEGLNSASAQDSLETGSAKNDRSEFPETSSSERGWNQEAGTEPVENQEGSVHNQTDPVRQEGLDKNKDYHHSGDQSYQDEQPKNTGIGSHDEIAPDREEAHRQAREELSTATDTLDYASDRRADPDKVGDRVENMADTVSERMHEKDRARHGLED